MGLCISTTSHRQSTGRVALCGDFQWLSPRATSIHILDDDSLLHVFYLCRPIFRDEDGPEEWKYNEVWWYALAHVCRRWRNIIHGSATYLGLSLLCTYGTPVAEMLANSPPFPLVIGYFIKGRELTTEDEEGIILALKRYDRVRRVRLSGACTAGPAGTVIQKLILAMDEEYPILESLYTVLRDYNTILTIPGTFQAPHLRELVLQGFALPIGSQLLTTAVGLTTLRLIMVHPSTYFHPNTLLQCISFMPHLETLKILFKFSIPNRDVERQLTHTPIIPHITLPNLHCFHFQGVGTYLEALVHRITTPRLKTLKINFFNQLTISVPRLLQFIDRVEDLRFTNALLTFSDKDVAARFSQGESKAYVFNIAVKCCHLDWQASSMAQISNSLGQMFSSVEYLVLHHRAHNQSSEEHNEVDRTEWRNLLRPFSNVKTLRVGEGLFKDLSRCLELEDGEFPLELLPELQELRYYGSSDTGGAFTSFIDTRRNAGRPVTLVYG